MVQIAGASVPRNDQNGWAYGAGFRSIELRGTACAQAKSGGAQSVQITLLCPSDPIP